MAPASIVNGTIDAVIAAGSAPLDGLGSYTLSPNAAGNYTISGSAGAGSTSGTFSYERYTPKTGLFHFTDAGSGLTYNDTLTFTTTTAGSYSIVSAIPGQAGTQSGTFTFTPPAAVVAPDIITSFFYAPFGTFVGGDQSTAVITVKNVGTLGAHGDITIGLFLTPDGNPADGTEVTSTVRTITLPVGAAPQSFNVEYIYPQLSLANNFLVATVTPAATIPESDPTNDTAFSFSLIQLSPQNVDLAATQVGLVGVGADGIITGTSEKALVTILNDGNRTIAGAIHIGLYTALTPTGPDTPVISKPRAFGIDLLPGHQAVATVPFFAPSETMPQAEYFVATIDTSGVVIESNLVNGVDANNTVATLAPILVTPATVTIVSTLLSTLPPSAVAGTLSNVQMQVQNVGNTPFLGYLPIRLTLTPPPSPDEPDDLLLYGTEYLLLDVGAIKQFKLNFSWPTNLTDGGSYQMQAQTTTATTNVNAAAGLEVVQVAPSNVALSSSPVIIDQPLVELSAQTESLAATTFNPGAVVNFPIALTNNGNVAAMGPYTIQLFATPTTPSDPATVPMTVVLNRNMNIPIGATATVIVQVKLPKTLSAGVNYFWFANLNTAKITDTNLAALQPLSTQTFSVSG